MMALSDWYGIIPPMVTPLTPEDTVDAKAFQEEVEYLLAAGVNGLCVTGSTGEAAGLTLEETVEAARIVVNQVRGRVPVISGIIQNSTKVVGQFAKALREVGVDGLQITPVHYLFTPDADATVAFYRAVGMQAELPILIYNVVPWAFLEPWVLIRVMQEVPWVKGVKQSGGDMHKLADLLAAMEGRGLIFSAIDDLLYPSFCLGARGAIAAILTALPRTTVALWQAVRQGDHARALLLHKRVLVVRRALQGPNMPARLKVFLSCQNRQGGAARPPMTPVSDDQRTELEGVWDSVRVYEQGI